jgi:hypothetical protein
LTLVEPSITLKSMKITDPKKQLKEVGVTLKRNEYDGFEVRLSGAPKSQIYFTTDLQDAVDTGYAIAQEAK